MNPAPIDEVADLLRALVLPHMRAAAPELLATAKTQRRKPAQAMRALLTEELAGRQASSIRSRRKAAGFPTAKTFHPWDDTASTVRSSTPRSLPAPIAHPATEDSVEGPRRSSRQHGTPRATSHPDSQHAAPRKGQEGHHTSIV